MLIIILSESYNVSGDIKELYDEICDELKDLFCTFAFDLMAKSYNNWYANCKVIIHDNVIIFKITYDGVNLTSFLRTLLLIK